MNTLAKKVTLFAVLAGLVLSIVPSISKAAEDDAAQANSIPLQVKLLNETGQDLDFFVDMRCAEGPDYQQTAYAKKTRDLNWESYGWGSCFLAPNTVRLMVKNNPHAFIEFFSPSLGNKWNKPSVSADFGKLFKVDYQDSSHTTITIR